MATAQHPIALYTKGARAEQSSAEVWQAASVAVREALAIARTDPRDIVGVGFDATCALVVMGPTGGLPAGDSGDPERDIIVWMDHRAVEQAERINRTSHAVLAYVGNRISSEMQTPKLSWLKENRPQVFAGANHFFDLSDFLTWKATGSQARSICTTTCKWTYLGHEKKRDPDYFRTIGLSELVEEKFARIGSEVVEVGTRLGTGLTAATAQAPGLAVGTPVAASLIDAHAGGVGTLGASGRDAADSAISRMAYVFGTSACTMTSTREPVFVPGAWGP